MMSAKKLFALIPLYVLLTTGTLFAQGEGDRYISEALEYVRAIRTVECDIRIETVVNGKEHTFRGSYAEQVMPQADPQTFLRSMYRLELYSTNVSLGNDAKLTRMTLVCHLSPETNTYRLERYTCVEGVEEFTIIDLNRLDEQLRATNRKLVFAQVSEVRNLGGLAGMIRQISRFYEFSVPDTEDLQGLQGNETIPALRLTGKIRPHLHKDLLQQFGGLDKRGRYPANFPSDIEVWIGRHNSFPYKVRYLRRISESSDQMEMLFQESFVNVNLGGTPIPAAKFVLKPPANVFEQDDTENFINALGL